MKDLTLHDLLNWPAPETEQRDSPMPDLTDLLLEQEAAHWVRLIAAERVVAAVRHSLEHSRYAVNEEIVQAMRAGGFWVGEQRR